jgi:hypothetical protein
MLAAAHNRPRIPNGTQSFSHFAEKKVKTFSPPHAQSKPSKLRCPHRGRRSQGPWGRRDGKSHCKRGYTERPKQRASDLPAID